MLEDQRFTQEVLAAQTMLEHLDETQLLNLKETYNTNFAGFLFNFKVMFTAIDLSIEEKLESMLDFTANTDMEDFEVYDNGDNDNE